MIKKGTKYYIASKSSNEIKPFDKKFCKDQFEAEVHAEQSCFILLCRVVYDTTIKDLINDVRIIDSYTFYP